MDIQLYSIEHAPVHLPVWQLILDDLGRPPAARVAKALDIGVRTVHRYNADNAAPRAACLALFWLTRWGRSQIDAQATNDARTAVAYARALERELADQRMLVARLQALGDFGAANAPLLGKVR